MGFASMEVDQSLYIFCSGENTISIWIHVDDGIVASNSTTAVLDFKRQLCEEVDIKWHNTISQIEGLECMFVLPPTGPAVEGDKLDATPFCLVIGSLAYLISSSHPDLAFAVNYMARHLMAPTKAHWDVLDHVVGYLLKTQDY
ncbi:hypothetical protein O181_003846 [Austropuccinia psidii MF-1]|uniref:Reverse transcriptase Ty1/copia-type domain-containing protein n=1 Tax=Austropuccinia psidii MF-1 TaxID=1389203 RepID=A0A9Q3BEE4_9BASI|nr:hypothetical protein [Austropuccinia psidii MF-1]